MNTMGKAVWITGDGSVPVFVKHFSAKKPVKATLRATACGIYEASLNGRRVGNDLLRPGWTNYRKRIQVQTYDVTNYLENENTLEITAAPGWWAGYLNGEGKNHHYGDRVAIYATLTLTYEDGTECEIVTDESWQVKQGPVRSAELYHGETIDFSGGADCARIAVHSARRYELPYPAELVDQVGPSVQIVERFPVRETIITPRGETVLDFGQNIAGFVELRVRGRRGQTITLRHAEVLDRDGNFYTTNLRTARAEDTFILSGGDDVFCPRFTFHGFRYVSVDGLTDETRASFSACAISSAIKKTADFHCSNDLVNRLWENINWSMRDNFVDLPTDCPQRDERLGWTGDAAIFSRTAGELYDTLDFFRKYLLDLASEQSVKYGLPDTVPNILMPPETPSGGSAVWGDACTLIPWNMYCLYGDASILEAQYESMKNWVEFMRRTETADHLHKSGHQRGDWLALDREEGRGMSGSTDPYLISTAFYAESTRILAESAGILGLTDDAEEYGNLYKGIVEGFRREFITATGRVVTETQTALALILCFKLARPEHEAVIARTLADNLARHHFHITTGFIGTPYLMKALSEASLHEAAVRLLLNEEYPGWLREVKLGATTIWERWDSMHDDGSFDESGMNSFNHYSFGAIGAWMLENLAGIEAKEAGYRVISFRPSPVYGLTEVSASRTTPYGEAKCAWTCRNGQITVSVTVPEGTTAELQLPEKDGLLELTPGTYDYAYATDTVTAPQRYTMESTIAELAENPVFVSGVDAVMPGTSKNLSMEFLRTKTLSELITMMPGGAEAAFRKLLVEMNG